jgi:hypothetical protein
MTREYVTSVLALIAVAKEVILVDGERYRVRGSEEWSATPSALILLQDGVTVYIAYRNIASIHLIERPSEEA